MRPPRSKVVDEHTSGILQVTRPQNRGRAMLRSAMVLLPLLTLLLVFASCSSDSNPSGTLHNDPPSEEEDDQEEEDDSELDFSPIAGNWVGELTALPPYGNNCKFRFEFSLDSTALKNEAIGFTRVWYCDVVPPAPAYCSSKWLAIDATSDADGDLYKVTEEQSAGTCPRGDVQLRPFADSDSLRVRIDAELDGVGADATGNASRMAE